MPNFFSDALNYNSVPLHLTQLFLNHGDCQIHWYLSCFHDTFLVTVFSATCAQGSPGLDTAAWANA